MPPTAYAVQHVGRMTIVRLYGDLDIAAHDDLKVALQPLPCPWNTAVVLEMGHVTFMDCSSANLMAAMAIRCRRARIGVGISGANAAITRTLDVTRLDELLPIDAGIGDALERALTYTHDHAITIDALADVPTAIILPRTHPPQKLFSPSVGRGYVAR